MTLLELTSTSKSDIAYNASAILFATLLLSGPTKVEMSTSTISAPRSSAAEGAGGVPLTLNQTPYLLVGVLNTK